MQQSCIDSCLLLCRHPIASRSAAQMQQSQALSLTFVQALHWMLLLNCSRCSLSLSSLCRRCTGCCSAQLQRPLSPVTVQAAIGDPFA